MAGGVGEGGVECQKGKGKGPGPGGVHQGVKKMLLCKPGTGKSMSSQACQVVKAWCERPGEEPEPKVVHWRKHTEVESPCSEKKKVQTEELLKGSEKSDGGLAVKEVRVLILGAELKLLFQGLFVWPNCQNDLLEVLLEVKTEEVMLLLGVEVNKMEEIDEEEDMEVNEEEVRELSMEGPKEAEESEKGPSKAEGSKQGMEALESAEAEKGSQSMKSTESGGNGDDETEV